MDATLRYIFQWFYIKLNFKIMKSSKEKTIIKPMKTSTVGKSAKGKKVTTIKS